MKANKLFIALFISIILITSCEKQIGVDQESLISISQSDREIINKLGFDTSHIRTTSEYYIVEGDIMLKKANLPFYVVNPKSRLKQFRANALVSLFNVHDITVKIDESIPYSGDDNWRDAVEEAITEWNNTSSFVHMSLTTSNSADIVVKSDNSSVLEDGIGFFENGMFWWYYEIAQAEWPIYSNPGNTIIVNLNAKRADNSEVVLSNLQKKYNIIHELGHCLGLMHTNGGSGIAIPNTPVNGNNPDPSSVMNGGTAEVGWSRFSDYDLIAIRTLYPWYFLAVNGPNSGYNDESYYYYPVIDAGPQITQPYTYNWEISEMSAQDWQPYSTSYSVWVQLSGDVSYDLKLTVTSANGYVIEHIKHIANKGDNYER